MKNTSVIELRIIPPFKHWSIEVHPVVINACSCFSYKADAEIH